MPRTHCYRLRGISEYVSAALLAIIVLGVGGLVVSRIIETTYTAQQQAEQQSVRAKVEAMQDLTIALAYINQSDVLHVVVVTDNTPVLLYDVYVNNTLWSDNCTARLNNGSEYHPVHNVRLPYYAAADIECTLPAGTSLAEVKLVYQGGEAYASAKKP
ncbi:hypothetical protein PYJP_16530 [Pyrofollis japonicus]|uniref:hypothetical protein n=1 Tax=Pyrofollis japonicus TaxID=3060460 RepID=UPI00295AADCF|nr:hypothetical protein [Pyrofollis japonicus]BEP18301.1 hypothetical protein PYJP_16530 [Pyrofollis japonicus]